MQKAHDPHQAATHKWHAAGGSKVVHSQNTVRHHSSCPSILCPLESTKYSLYHPIPALCTCLSLPSPCTMSNPTPCSISCPAALHTRPLIASLRTFSNLLNLLVSLLSHVLACPHRALMWQLQWNRLHPILPSHPSYRTSV